jgi:hypothetical protein
MDIDVADLVDQVASGCDQSGKRAARAHRGINRLSSALETLV